MEVNTKAILASIGMLFVIFTLVFGVVEVITIGSDVATMFIIMAAISAVFSVFIADGCKRRLWSENSNEPNNTDSNE